MASEIGTTRLWEELEPLVDGYIADEVGMYLERQQKSEQERIAEGLNQLREQSTPAFRAAVQADIGVGVPTSFQEKSYVRTALDQYPIQRELGQHRIIGYLNWPDSLSSSDAASTRNILDMFISEHPHVPYAYMQGPEHAPIAIGGIRKYTTDILQAITTPDALLTSHDADQEELTPTYLRELQLAYEYRQHRRGTRGHRWAGIIPHLKHTRLPEQPNMDLAIRWYEDQAVLDLVNSFFEPGPAFGAPEYRQIGGYNPTHNLAETHNLIYGINAYDQIDARGLLPAPSAVMTLSPRRLVHKLRAGYTLDQIWSGGQDFNATNEYRDAPSADIVAGRDLPDTHLAYLLRCYGRALLEHTVVAADRNPRVDDPLEYAEEQLEAIRARLGGPEDMFATD